MADTSDSTLVRLGPLHDWAVRLLVKQGMFAAEADTAALRLMEAELLGRTAGGLRWLPRLLAAMEVGDIDPRARLVTTVDLPALLVLDGGTGVGQVTITSALQLAAKKAQTAGSAVAVVRNSRPLGDPTACLAAATSAGCAAGIMTTCKPQAEPWPIGPCTVWGWPGTDSPLVTSGAPPEMSHDLSAAVLPTAFCGTKPSSVKKRLFADDAEHICFVTDITKCREMEQFQALVASQGMDATAWIFDRARWPETAVLGAGTVCNLRELAASSRVAGEWE